MKMASAYENAKQPPAYSDPEGSRDNDKMYDYAFKRQRLATGGMNARVRPRQYGCGQEPAEVRTSPLLATCASCLSSDSMSLCDLKPFCVTCNRDALTPKETH